VQLIPTSFFKFDPQIPLIGATRKIRNFPREKTDRERKKEEGDSLKSGGLNYETQVKENT
jgi:hypothetical protein